MERVTREWFTPRTWKFLVGGLIVVFALAYLIFTAAGSSMVYRLSIAELKGDPSMVGKRVRVGGVVNWESMQRDEEALTLTFTLEEDGDSLPVVYQGVVPDTFETAPGVTLEGEYTAEGIFQADTILLQCPSKYEATSEE
ncbi:MAG: cytochrome c maturation protein CcmE [Anaerolineae bacterium]